MHKASINGNWEAAKVILDTHPELVRFAINENWETPLHVAVSAEENKLTELFVKNLVDRMKSEELELPNKSGNTALCLASTAGNNKMVMTMVAKNPGLLNIPGSQRMMPLYLSALHGRYNTLKYLYNSSNKMTGDYWTHQNRGWVLLKCVEYDFFGKSQLQFFNLFLVLLLFQVSHYYISVTNLKYFAHLYKQQKFIIF